MPLLVDGQLELESGGHSVLLTGLGSSVELRVRGTRGVRRLFPGGRMDPARAARLDRALAASGLGLTVRVGPVPVLMFGDHGPRGARSPLVSRVIARATRAWLFGSREHSTA